MLETIGRVHGSDAHNKVDLDTIGDLERVHMQWEGLLKYAESVVANWPASATVHVPLSKHAGPDKSSSPVASASKSSKTGPAKQYTGLI